MAGAFLSPEELTALLNQQTGTPQRSAGAFAAPQMAPDPFAGQTAEMGFSPEDPTMSTGDMNLAPAPQRMLAGAWDMIARKRQAGVPLSPQEEAMVASGEQYKTEIGEPTARRTMDVMGVGRTMEAGRDFYNDPSLATATNLGTNAAMTAFRPMAAAKILGAGYGAAAAQDAGLSPFGTATATGSEDGLNDAQRARLRELEGKIGKGAWKTGAERRAVEDEARGIRNIRDQFYATANTKKLEAEAAKGASQQAEFDSSVKRAERMRDTELARDNRFADSAVGKVYDKTGIVTPLLAAIGAGGLSRAASGGGSIAKNYVLPGATGAGTGFVAAHYPLAHDAMFTPPDNPERRAYEAYSRELPPEHPRKQEWQTYARGLSEENPVRKVASQELYDPTKFLERSAVGTVEGILGGLAGSELARLPLRAIQAAAATPGIVKNTFQKSWNAGAPKAAAGDATLEQATNATRTARDATLLAEEAKRLQPRSGAETAAGPAQSPRPGSSRTPEAQAAGQQLSPSGGSQRSSSVSPSNKSQDNTAAVSPRQFVAGQRPVPVSGMSVNELLKNETVQRVAAELAAERALTAANLSKRLIEEGLEVGNTQIGTAARRLKQDEVLRAVQENVKKDRQRMQRAARRAQEKKNAEKPPTDTDL